MRTAVSMIGVCALLCGMGASDALAQRGIGDATGVARAAVKPQVETLSGEVTSVETGPCKNTTGRAVIGTHILLKTPDGRQLNVHLGPEPAVRHVAKRLAAGQKVTVRAFRTAKMSKGHYVAQSLAVGDQTFRLRDEMLRPVWAGGRGFWPDQGTAQPEAAYGYGRGRGGYGRGYGRGQGRGRGMGYGAGPMRGQGFGR